MLIEYTVRMQLSDQHFVVIESPFTLTRRGETFSLTPESDPNEAFEPVRQLVGQEIEEASADASGALRIKFRNETRLRVEADDRYEAWNVSGPGGALVVCTPGGELACWDALPDSSDS